MLRLAPPRLRRMRQFSLFFALLLVVFLCYRQTFHSPLVLDDVSSFVEVQSVHVADFSVESLRQISRSPFGVARVIPMLSFAVDHQLGGGSIVQFHLTNLVIHLLATTAVFFFVFSLLETTVGRKALKCLPPATFAFFVAALWALNPVQTNAVTYIVQRMASLAALFYCLACVFYLRSRLAGNLRCRWGWGSGCVVAAILAFCSKENSVILPLTLVLIESLFLSPGLAAKAFRRIRPLHWFSLVAMIILLLPLTAPFWHQLVIGYQGRPFAMGQRLLTEMRVIFFYLSLLLLPLPGRMNLDHDFPLSQSLLTPLTTLWSLLGIIAILAGAHWQRKKAPLLAFGIYWFFLNLLIESSFLPLEIIFEHRLYLPSIGVAITVLSALDLLLASFSPQQIIENRRVHFLSLAILACLSGVLTSYRNSDWRDGLTFTRDCMVKSPAKPRTHVNYGQALGKAGRYEEAIAEFAKAVALGRPLRENYVAAANNMLIVHLLQRKVRQGVDKAEEHLQFILARESAINMVSMPKFVSNLAKGYLLENRYREAYAILCVGLSFENESAVLVGDLATTLRMAQASPAGRAALKLGSDKSDCFLLMAEAMLSGRKYALARQYLEKMDAEALASPRGQALRQRLGAEIEKNRTQAWAIDITRHPVYRQNLRYRFHMATAGFISKYYPPLRFAVGWFLNGAESLSPHDPFVACRRCEWLFTQGSTEQAVEVLGEALTRHPDFVPILELAGKFYAKQGDVDRAAHWVAKVLEQYPAVNKWGYYHRFVNRVERHRQPS